MRCVMWRISVCNDWNAVIFFRLPQFVWPLLLMLSPSPPPPPPPQHRNDCHRKSKGPLSWKYARSIAMRMLILHFKQLNHRRVGVFEYDVRVVEWVFFLNWFHKIMHNFCPIFWKKVLFTFWLRSDTNANIIVWILHSVSAIFWQFFCCCWWCTLYVVWLYLSLSHAWLSMFFSFVHSLFHFVQNNYFIEQHWSAAAFKRTIKNTKTTTTQQANNNGETTATESK